MSDRGVMTKECYFAAANGYSGFRSYFGEVFRSDEFAKIYVLKGGPGTGKSSFMKKAENLFFEKGYKTEAIFCSSDPYSLDGVIVSGENSRVAILDGTSPHERDAVIPGAVDELINLGEFWDARWLSSERDKIIELNREKSAAYKTAYSYLGIAGSIKNKQEKLISRHIDRASLNSLKEKLLTELREQPIGKMRRRLISSFGKYGNYRLDTVECCSDKHFSVVGDEEVTREFLTLLSAELSACGVAHTVLPSALDERSLDGIMLDEPRISVMNGGDGEIIDLTSSAESAAPIDQERVRLSGELYNEALAEAQRWFSIASDIHFRLEDIYKRCMNFEEIDRIFKKKCEEIDNILISRA